MKTETFSGKMNSGRGQTFDKDNPTRQTPIEFKGTYEAYVMPEGKGKDKITLPTIEGADVIADGDVPTVADVYDYVNTQNKNNARQKAMNDALDAAGISKPDPNDPAVALARMLKDLEKVELTPEQKEAMASILRAKAGK